MIVQITFQEGGQWLSVNIEPLEFIEIIERKTIRGYPVATMKFFIGNEHDMGSQQMIYDCVLSGVNRISPWRLS